MARKGLVRHYNNGALHDSSLPAAPGSPKGDRIIIPPEVLRERAAASYEGGRCRCDVCLITYSANYVVPVRKANFSEGMVCRYCLKFSPAARSFIKL